MPLSISTQTPTVRILKFTMNASDFNVALSETILPVGRAKWNPIALFARQRNGTQPLLFSLCQLRQNGTGFHFLESQVGFNGNLNGGMVMGIDGFAGISVPPPDAYNLSLFVDAASIADGLIDFTLIIDKNP